MTGKQHPIEKLGVWLCLIFGAVIFSFPFVWMVCSSFKVDRELFPEKLSVFPGTPNALPVSPFVDRHYYKKAASRITKPFLDIFTQAIEEKTSGSSNGFALPSHVNREEIIREISLGLAKKLETMLPPDTWKRGEREIGDLTRKSLNEEVLGGILENVYRRMLIGNVMIRSNTRVEQILGQGIPHSRRFKVLTRDTATLIEEDDRGTPCALVKYDFAKGDLWKIQMTAETSFPVRDLYRIQISFRPDDNWHRLSCFVEKEGALYKSVRPIYPANFEWAVITYQEPGPDDHSNKIRSWINIREIDRGAQYLNDPRKIRITLEMKKSSLIHAWWGKICRNYYITADHIPLWRYISTSFYLVILNVFLSVFSCSLVAYAIARISWPGRNFNFLLMLATMMIPAQVTMIPGFLIWKYLGCYNTLVPLWLGAAFSAPFNVFLLRQFLKGIPRDLEEAARIDGCRFFQIYWHIMLPLVKPVLIVIGIGAFLGAWNNFVGPLIYIADQRLYPLAFGLFAFAVQIANNPSLTMAGSFIMSVPIVLVFFLAQKYFIQGITLTGLKG